MRKGITIVLLVSLMMTMLWGCGKTTKDPIGDLDLSGDVENRFVYAAKMYGKLIRYDVVDKKAVVACPDPLCGHDTKSCLATNIYTAHVGNDYIMYGRLEDGLLGGDTIYCYDLKRGTISKVMDCPRYQEIAFIKDAAYFSASHVEYDDDGKPQGEVWDVYRYTMASKELVKINDESLGNEVVVEDYTDRQIVWFDFGGSGSYFTTDYNFKNQAPTTNELKIGNYIYDIKTNYNEDDSFTHSIHRKEINTENWEEVVTGIFSYRLDNIDDPKGIVYNINEKGEWNSIYYKQLSDLSTRKIGTVPKGYTLTNDGVYPEMGTTFYAGGYIGIYVSKDNADHSESHNGQTVWFVNIDNGDNFIVTP